MADKNQIGVIVISMTCVEELFDEDEENLLTLVAGCLSKVSRNRRNKTENFFESTIPKYLPDTFKRFFRMSRQSFEVILQHFGTSPQLARRLYQGGRTEVPLEKAVLMTLRYFASQETVLEISDRFDVTEFTFLKYKIKVVNALNDCLIEKFIRFPTLNEIQEVTNKFDEMGVYHFPNIIGAVDGCHIAIDPPSTNPQAYYNRKKFYSVILQGVCKQDLQFININIGWPGRVHDAKVLRNSQLWSSGDELCHQGQYHLIGDGAYPLRRWLLTPYRHTGNIARQQKYFNKCLSSKRQVIEHAFGLLKGRFKRMRHINIKILKEFVDASVQHVYCTIFVFMLVMILKNSWTRIQTPKTMMLNHL